MHRILAVVKAAVVVSPLDLVCQCYQMNLACPVTQTGQYSGLGFLLLKKSVAHYNSVMIMIIIQPLNNWIWNSTIIIKHYKAPQNVILFAYLLLKWGVSTVFSSLKQLDGSWCLPGLHWAQSGPSPQTSRWGPVVENTSALPQHQHTNTCTGTSQVSRIFFKGIESWCPELIKRR